MNNKVNEDKAKAEGQKMVQEIQHNITQNFNFKFGCLDRAIGMIKESKDKLDSDAFCTKALELMEKITKGVEEKKKSELLLPKMDIIK